MKNFFKTNSFKRLLIIKNSIENGSKKKKILFNFCLIFFLFFIIGYFFVLVLRLFVASKFIILEIFPHCAMTERLFYEKYSVRLNELTFFQKLKYYWLDFINPTSIGFKILFILVICLLIYSIFFIIAKKMNKKKEEKFFIIANTDIKMNLLFYHFVANKLIEKMINDENFSFEDFHQTKNYIIENLIELYWIIKNHSAEVLLPIVIGYKKHLDKDLIENPNNVRQFVFDKMEKKHLVDLIELLEKKRKNNEQMPLLFDDFISEFSEIKIDDNFK